MKKLLFLILVISVFFSCDQTNNGESQTVAAGDFSYVSAWKKVEKFNEEKLPKSAYKEIERIYKYAKKENNSDQKIKALIFKIMYLAQVEEERIFKMQQLLLAELKTAEAPEKQLLHSIIAEVYWVYYQYNRVIFLSRSKTEKFKQDDMRTWSMEKIVEQVVFHYKESLDDEKVLKKTKTNQYKSVIKKGEHGLIYRPTLYDFLAHRAVDFCINNEANLTKPANEFSLNNKKYFLMSNKFIKQDITTPDKLSFHYHAITLFQSLIKFHIDDSNPQALVDVDLKRLKYIYNNTSLSDKDKIYENSLQEMAQEHKNSEAVASINYQLAELYYALGEKFQNKRFEKFRWYKKKALQLCEKSIKQYPKALGSKNCKYLATKIKEKNISLVLERALIPREPSRALVKYKNIDKIYLRVVKTNRHEFNKFNKLKRELMLAKYLTKKANYAWDQKLPDQKDYQDHSVEIKIAPLEPGEYIILGSQNKNFTSINHTIVYSYINVTNISYLERHDRKKGHVFSVLHRKTGQPLINVKAQVWYKYWNRSKKEYVNQKGKLFKTNKKGEFTIPYKWRIVRSFKLEFLSDKDSFFSNKTFYTYRSHHKYKETTQTFFFTDRKIYRPGQTVYFKGIKIVRNMESGKKNRILKKSYSNVVFYDVNRQKISNLKLKTNSYGTFSGSFKIPTGLLNGEMRIADRHGSISFSVEEYKRPKFEVTFNALDKEYRLNDIVKVSGNAKALAGFNIDNAQVKYRVVRKTFFPYRWSFWSRTHDDIEKEITSGYTKTDAKGEFSIKFKALPDSSLSKKSNAAFHFEVYADVTDINGETRSSQKIVSLGYVSLQLSTSIGDKINQSLKKYQYTISTTDLSGGFKPASGDISVYRLKTPQRIYRSRLWEMPDQHVMNRQDYYLHFKNDLYMDENDYTKWEKEKRIFTQKFNTKKTQTYNFNNLKQWSDGKYLVEVKSKDRYGVAVKDIKYFTLYSDKSKKMPYKMSDWFSVVKGSARPGEKAVFLIGSSEKNVRVKYNLLYKGQVVSEKILKINNELKRVVVPVREKHRGNLGVVFNFIKNNRIYTRAHTINVPWTNKDLYITFETFRNKLLPGEKEEWRLKIKGEKRDKFAAEMVATLYDASLDHFRSNSWGFNIYPSRYERNPWSADFLYGMKYSSSHRLISRSNKFYRKYYDQLIWSGLNLYGFNMPPGYRSSGYGYNDSERLESDFYEGEVMESKSFARASAPVSMEESSKKMIVSERRVDKSYNKGALKNGARDKRGQSSLKSVKARKNFNETAFFFPHLRTNAKGEIIVSFIVPETLTRWKMLGFAHTKDLKYGLTSNYLVTQKELMVIPNPPRFLREKDTLTFTAKISNLKKDILQGEAALMLFDAKTMRQVDSKFKQQNVNKSFKVKAGQSSLLEWKIKIPSDLDAVTYRVVARAGKFSDGEEKALPILKNRMLVTETLPLPVRSKQTKEFKLKKLIDSGKSKSLKHHKLTLEFTSNPAWYAVQALPYIMEYPYECMEQTFSRYYANSIASHIVNSNPKIKNIYNKWKKSKSSNALLSNLEKNQELKSLLVQETPWVLNAQNETERKRRIAILFDAVRMKDELGKAQKKLIEGQMLSGAWPWFNGMSENRYITQHIVTGYARLQALKTLDFRKKSKVRKMLEKALFYLDREIVKDYKRLIKNDIDLDKNNLSRIQIQYLYARSYFPNLDLAPGTTKAFSYYKSQAKAYWKDFGRYMQGMIALALDKYKDKQTPQKIVKSIKEHALYSEELGMYWNDSYGFYWYQAPIETHALMIELFSTVANDTKSVDELKTWLLKQKQTQDWKTTKATVEACYALLLQGENWLQQSKLADISLGNIKIDPSKMSNDELEPGTGYFKKSFQSKEIVSEMGNVIVKNNNNVAAWGGLYWQYFEDLDKITSHKTPLRLKKELFLEKSGVRGPVLVPVSKSKLRIGDRVKVRIELRVDRSMEYVHMKDMRAAGFEPENVISRYKYQDGLGYYESTKDASTNFFIDYLPKGTYVFEYPLRVTHRGNFSNGITTIQCMYAPEFSSHSKGIRVSVP